MSLDPQVTQLGVQLAEVGVRNTVTGVANRIRAVKARKQDQETINVLDEIVNDLLADKNQLVQIARGYEQVLDAQRISQEEISYITESIIPVIQTLVSADADYDGDEADAMIEMLKPILSVETITVLQLLGFNFKQAIGEPLTTLVAQLIETRAPASVVDSADLERRRLDLQLAAAELATDEVAFNRFTQLLGA